MKLTFWVLLCLIILVRKSFLLVCKDSFSELVAKYTILIFILLKEAKNFSKHSRGTIWYYFWRVSVEIKAFKSVIVVVFVSTLSQCAFLFFKKLKIINILLAMFFVVRMQTYRIQLCQTKGRWWRMCHPTIIVFLVHKRWFFYIVEWLLQSLWKRSLLSAITRSFFLIILCDIQWVAFILNVKNASVSDHYSQCEL